MALVMMRLKSYSIVKEKIMINRAIALCCCLFLSTVSFAQGGKLIKQTLQTGTKEGLAAQAGKQILPKMPAKVGQGAGTTSVAPKAGLRNAPRAAVSAQAGTPKERTPESFAQESPFPVFDQKAFLKKIGRAMVDSPNKKILNYATLLEQERTHARQLASLLKTYQTLHLDEIREAELLDGIDTTVVNHSLQRFLAQSISNQNYTQFMRDLSNYYSLSLEFMSSYDLRFIASQDVREVFARTALEYMKAHPHKVNLKLREILKSPFVEASVKASLRGFVAMDEILPQYENSFLTFLRTAHKQHTAGLTSARTAEDITITVGVYQELLAELEQFTSTFHRSPRWNSNEDERRLYNKVLMLITYNQVNQFKQVLPYISQIKNLLNKYPSIGLTTYETLEKLRTFIKETGHFPRQISEAKPGEVIPEEELHLYECMVYWSTANKNFATKITELRIIAPLL